MRKLVIEKAAVRSNMAVIRRRAAGAALYGVLTGDAGGAGLVPMARILRDEGVGRFAVGSVEEAQELREAGFVDEEILMLRATVDREELERLVDLNVVCTISSVDTGLALNAVAENRSTVAEAHIQVDTGMGFGGFLVGEPEKILLAYRSLPNVALSGIYTQLHRGLRQGAGGGGTAETVPPGAGRHSRRRVRDGTGPRRRVLRPDALRLRPAGRGAGGLGAAGPVPPRGRGRADHRGLWGGPPGRSALASQRTHGGLRPPHRLEKTHPGGGAAGGLSERLWGGAAPYPQLLDAVEMVAGTRKRSVRIGAQRAPIVGAIGATETILNVTDVKCSAGDLAVFDLDPLYARGVHIEYR